MIHGQLENTHTEAWKVIMAFLNVELSYEKISSLPLKSLSLGNDKCTTHLRRVPIFDVVGPSVNLRSRELLHHFICNPVFLLKFRYI